jgi:hypothetical protein
MSDIQATNLKPNKFGISCRKEVVDICMESAESVFQTQQKISSNIACKQQQTQTVAISYTELFQSPRFPPFLRLWFGSWTTKTDSKTQWYFVVCGLDELCIRGGVSVGSRMFSSSRCLNRLSGPPSLLYNGYWRVKWPGRESDPSSPNSAEIKKRVLYIYSATRLQGVALI